MGSHSGAQRGAGNGSHIECTSVSGGTLSFTLLVKDEKCFPYIISDDAMELVADSGSTMLRHEMHIYYCIVQVSFPEVPNHLEQYSVDKELAINLLFTDAAYNVRLELGRLISKCDRFCMQEGSELMEICRAFLKYFRSWSCVPLRSLIKVPGPRCDRTVEERSF